MTTRWTAIQQSLLGQCHHKLSRHNKTPITMPLRGGVQASSHAKHALDPTIMEGGARHEKLHGPAVFAVPILLLVYDEKMCVYKMALPPDRRNTSLQYSLQAVRSCVSIGYPLYVSSSVRKEVLNARSPDKQYLPKLPTVIALRRIS